MFGVPASNLCGMTFQLVLKKSTLEIISPPPWYGGVSLRISRVRKARQSRSDRKFYDQRKRGNRSRFPAHPQEGARALRGIHQGYHPHRTGFCAQFRTGLIVQGCWKCASSRNFHTVGKQGVDPRQVKQSLVTGNRHVTQLRSGSRRQKLPRHDVAMMLHFGEQNFVPRLQMGGSPGLGDQVDPSVVPRVKTISCALPALINRAAAFAPPHKRQWRGCSIHECRDGHCCYRTRNNAATHPARASASGSSPRYQDRQAVSMHLLLKIGNRAGLFPVGFPAFCSVEFGIRTENIGQNRIIKRQS